MSARAAPSGDSAPEPRTAALRRFVARWVAVTWVVTLMGFAGGLHWTLDLLAAFRPQYAALLVAAAGAAALLRRRKLFAWSLAGAVLNAALVAPLYFGGDAADGDRPALRLLLFNVNTANGSPDAVVEYVRASDADLVALLEVNGAWMDRLTTLAPGYVVAAAEPRADNFGLTLLRRIDGVRARVLPYDPAWDTPSIEALVPWDGAEIDLLVTHPLPPVGSRNVEDRARQTDALAAWASGRERPAIVLGDLNAAPWMASFRDLLGRTELRNSQAGFGLQPTWPAPATPFLVPLDHCLHDASIVTVERSTGPHLGSDHLPLHVALRLR